MRAVKEEVSKLGDLARKGRLKDNKFVSITKSVMFMGTEVAGHLTEMKRFDNDVRVKKSKQRTHVWQAKGLVIPPIPRQEIMNKLTLFKSLIKSAENCINMANINLF